MHHARHPLHVLLAIATLMGLAACNPSAPLTTTATQTATDAPAETAAPAAAETPVAAAETAETATIAETAPTSPAVAPFAADPAARDAVITAMRKFLALRSYRVTIINSDDQKASLPSTLEYLAPDRYRMETPGTPPQVVIGNNLYLTAGGRTKASPVPAGTTSKWRDPVDFMAADSSFIAEKGARRFVFGVPSSEYKIHFTKPVTSDMSLWIGPNGLPVKLESQGQLGGNTFTTVRKYSHYDSSDIKIATPK